LADPSVLELVDLEALMNEDVACSSAPHATSPKFHGDPALPAEFMIKFLCTACGKTGRRPVCRFFAMVTIPNPSIIGTCSCGHKCPLAEAFVEIVAL
jgi:hypothetical protein